MTVRSVCWSLMGCLIWISSAPAGDAEVPLRLEVSAGQFERRNTPVRVLVELPEEQKDAQTAVLQADGVQIVGQFTEPRLLAEATNGKRELHFVLPRLDAGRSLLLEAHVGEITESEESFRWQAHEDQWTELQLGRRPVLRYMHAPLDTSTDERREETYKVYHHVYDPQGERFVTKGPGGLFPHHRGLFYGFNRIQYGDRKQADVWHCRQGEHQSHHEFKGVEEGPVVGRHQSIVGWYGRENDLFAREQRELAAYNVPEGVLIEFASRLETQVGPVRLDGDPQHAGFQFRASQEVPDETADQTYYLRPDGKGEPGRFRNWPDDEDHVDLPWHGLSFVLGDQRYTCLYIDRPDNPKEARFSERDYGRFGSYFEFDLDDENSLEIAYRVWLQEGEMTVDEAQALANDFVEPVTVEVK
jgi:hypothetical protein